MLKTANSNPSWTNIFLKSPNVFKCYWVLQLSYTNLLMHQHTEGMLLTAGSLCSLMNHPATPPGAKYRYTTGLHDETTRIIRGRYTEKLWSKIFELLVRCRECYHEPKITMHHGTPIRRGYQDVLVTTSIECMNKVTITFNLCFS